MLKRSERRFLALLCKSGCTHQEAQAILNEQKASISRRLNKEIATLKKEKDQ